MAKLYTKGINWDLWHIGETQNNTTDKPCADWVIVEKGGRPKTAVVNRGGKINIPFTGSSAEALAKLKETEESNIVTQTMRNAESNRRVDEWRKAKAQK